MHGLRLSRPCFLLVAALVAVGAFAVPAAAAADAHADRDGDKVFDELERTLAALPAEDAVAVIVRLTAPATAARVTRLSRAAGTPEVGERFTLVDGFAARLSRAEVRALAREDEVLSIEADLKLRATNAGAQAGFGVAKARLDSGLDGNGAGTADEYAPGDLVAAVLDTGIHSAHLDLNGRKVLWFVDCTGSACVPALPIDPNGHGTHVAATIAGDGEARGDRRDRGVAPAAALVGVRVLGADGSGSMSNFIEGLQWVVANRAAHGIEVVNASLSADGCSNGTDAASTAVDNAVAAGLVVVLAAGNEGPERCTISAPAAAARAVTVGAMSDVQRGGFALASFSSRGPTLDGRVKPDLVAPGVDIVSAAPGTTSGYAVASGTSMASPFVAGVALLMLQANPGLTPAEVKARLLATAVDWNAPGPDPETGAGRLDAYAAIAAAGAALTSPPTAPQHLLRTGSVAATGLSVDVPLTVATGGLPFAATAIAPTWSTASGTPDFDLALIDQSGSVLATGSTPFSFNWPGRRRQESIAVANLPAGPYTLRVTAVAGSGSFVLDVSGGFAAEPRATAPPAIAGAAVVGATLTASGGTWDAPGPYTLSYRWRRCDAAATACSEIAGATGASYVIPATDVAARLQVSVTATDASGVGTAVSAPTAVVAPPPNAAPVVRALASRGRAGRSVRLLYRVSDEGNRTSELVRVYRGGRVLRTIRTPLSARESGRTYYVFWRAPRRPERLRFCVRAWDAAGQASARRCASLLIR